MLKIDNITSPQGVYDYYSKYTNSDNNILQQGIIKDTFSKSTNKEEVTYSFSGINYSKDSFNSLSPILNKASENLPAGSRYLAKTIATEKQNDLDEKTGFTTDLTLKLLQYINKDIRKQIEILNKYNLSKVNKLIKSIDFSQLM